uniref:Uncharacterized protein n=1 Tax=Anopheles arabiensis TaxID=7173 RepID=A0A182IFK5_ANOAR
MFRSCHFSLQALRKLWMVPEDIF